MLSGRIKKRTIDHSFFRPIGTSIDRKLTFSAFHRGVDLPLLFTLSQFFNHLAQKNQIGYCKGAVGLHMQYPARVTNSEFLSVYYFCLGSRHSIQCVHLHCDIQHHIKWLTRVSYRQCTYLLDSTLIMYFYVGILPHGSRHII